MPDERVTARDMQGNKQALDLLELLDESLE
jgi:hypothetical protein